MKKFVAATLIGSLVLASCNGEEEGQEAEEAEGTEEEPAEEESSEAEQNDDSASDDSADDEAGSESEAEDTESEDSSAGENDETGDDENGGNEDRDLASEDIDPDDIESDGGDIENDGTSVDFVLNPNEDLVSLINEAEETDMSVEEVLTPASEVSSYLARTGLGVFSFEEGSDEPATYDTVALDGEVDESDGLELYVEERNLETEEYFEHGYGNADEDHVFLHDGQNWVDQSGQASPEEIMHGLYSNVEPVLTELGDLIEVRETEDYYVLYYLGPDDGEIYDSLGALFNVEFTNADMDSLEAGIFGVINKSTDELEHMSHVSHATGLDSSQEMQIDVVVDFLEYGNYDGAVEPPQSLDIEEAAGSSDTSDGSEGSSEESGDEDAANTADDNLSVGDSVEIDGVTFTLDDVSYTDERNEYADIEADEVLVLSVSYENNTGEEYFPGQDLSVYVDGSPAETYPVEDVALDSISDSRNTSGNLAFAVTGDPSEIEVEFLPVMSMGSDPAIFSVEP